MVVKLEFRSKTYMSGRSDKAVNVLGDLYFKFQIVGTSLRILGAQVSLKETTEINQHQQKTMKNKIRDEFSNKFSVDLTTDKYFIELDELQLKWLNIKLKTIGSILGISNILTGNNTGGSQMKKELSEYKLHNGQHEGKSFFNLLRVFTENGVLKYLDFNTDNYISYDEFIKIASDISEVQKYIMDDFYSPINTYFYIDEMRDLLVNWSTVSGSETDKDIISNRRKFRISLINKYNRIDQLYKVFTAKRMVEAAHIKPVSHSDNLDEVSDIENGLLLSPDIHKLFDAGYITFDGEGKVIFTTSNKDTEFNITKNEVERLKLYEYKIDEKLMTIKRKEYLEYHKENVYHKGI